MERNPCPLCYPADETLLWQGAEYRVIAVSEPGYPGYCRVIWNRHVQEMSQLASAERHRLMDAICAVEAVLLSLLQPITLNLASLGNQVPHLHWHIIPRFTDDPCYPAAIWAEPKRPAPARAIDPETLRVGITRALLGLHHL